MTGSELYTLLNYSALFFGFALYIWVTRLKGKWAEVFFLIFCAAAFSALLPISDTYPILNSLLLFLCLRHIFSSKTTMLGIYSGLEAKRSAVWGVLLFLIALTYIFSGVRGWQSVMVTSVRYWIILLSFFGWRSSTSTSEKTIFVAVLFSLGMVWGSKIVIVCGAVLFIFQFIKVSSLKNRLLLSCVIFSSLLIITITFTDQVQSFLNESVFRPDYDKDIKVLGLSDGSRITLWTYYLQGAHLFGKGDYFGEDQAPTHNIFIYFVYEFGIFPAFLATVALLHTAYRCAKASGIEFLLILSFCFLLSSIFEYGTGWVVPLIVIPFFAVKKFKFS